MTFKKAVCASTLAAGVGITGLLGLGVGIASADPGPGCDRPGAPCDHRDDFGPGRDDWGHRGIDEGRRDHQPFNWNGQRVIPMHSGDGRGWGFWFLGTWIPM
ncbi:hypothetical protein M2272_000588 [Mycobacterium frederiksbergense]|uniref:Uncharacterized protein n=1 Tax=Mycolicibacterium frederiksbergense TaxID=117567 RepID=A0ABT6KVF6_9MYCO|nr:hypothetical protein [Mycolicibacterium frederiksbergense]MDH6193967.1 hypothetical protein [Mycolicibacterium frederiksbergense]